MIRDASHCRALLNNCCSAADGISNIFYGANNKPQSYKALKCVFNLTKITSDYGLVALHTNISQRQRREMQTRVVPRRLSGWEGKNRNKERKRL